MPEPPLGSLVNTAIPDSDRPAQNVTMLAAANVARVLTPFAANVIRVEDGLALYGLNISDLSLTGVIAGGRNI
jgi:hypothetical protein